MRVLFWGTPDFAAPALRALLGEGYEVVGVVTQPDRPQGRHRNTLVASPVKTIAVEEEIPVFQPERPRGDEFIASMTELEPDVSVVVAYGELLPSAVISLPTHGTLNIHASLLPRWRGAAPIQAALLAGDGETGVTIMRMVDRLDAGPILLQAPTPIPDDETYGELHGRLAELGALAIVEALVLLSLGDAPEHEQDDARVTWAPKIDRARTVIDWSGSATQVARTVRAFDPEPGALTSLDGNDVKLFGARVADGTGAPGDVLGIDDQGILVACGLGAVRFSFAQPAGKRRISGIDWARGRGIRLGDRFGG